jgi:hypothetical protein
MRLSFVLIPLAMGAFVPHVKRVPVRVLHSPPVEDVRRSSSIKSTTEEPSEFEDFHTGSDLGVLAYSNYSEDEEVLDSSRFRHSGVLGFRGRAPTALDTMGDLLEFLDGPPSMIADFEVLRAQAISRFDDPFEEEELLSVETPTTTTTTTTTTRIPATPPLLRRMAPQSLPFFAPATLSLGTSLMSFAQHTFAPPPIRSIFRQEDSEEEDERPVGRALKRSRVARIGPMTSISGLPLTSVFGHPIDLPTQVEEFPQGRSVRNQRKRPPPGSTDMSTD